MFRWAKALLLIATACGALRLLHPGAAAHLQRWAEQLPVAAAQHAVARIAGLPFIRIKELTAALLAYAAIFLVEGTGLWLGKVWAEWFTLIVTASFIPFEVYEVVHGSSALKIALLVVNIVIVVYLAVRRYASRR